MNDELTVNVEELEDQHEPMEATGGYIECSCGWPTKQQWEAGMSFVRHILEQVETDRKNNAQCCDLHNRNCVPPSELCCQDCTEANHPNHPTGEQCVMS